MSFKFGFEFIFDVSRETVAEKMDMIGKGPAAN